MILLTGVTSITIGTSRTATATPSRCPWGRYSPSLTHLLAVLVTSEGAATPNRLSLANNWGRWQFLWPFITHLGQGHHVPCAHMGRSPQVKPRRDARWTTPLDRSHDAQHNPELGWCPWFLLSSRDGGPEGFAPPLHAPHRPTNGGCVEGIAKKGTEIQKTKILQGCRLSSSINLWRFYYMFRMVMELLWFYLYSFDLIFVLRDWNSKDLICYNIVDFYQVLS